MIEAALIRHRKPIRAFLSCRSNWQLHNRMKELFTPLIFGQVP